MLADGAGRPDAPDLLAYCLMPNQWHLVVQAGRWTNLSTWMQWLAVTHAHRRTAGEGPLDQGRFKSFPVQADAHFLRLCRYVEANAVRAMVAPGAEHWRWCSLWARRNRGSTQFETLRPWPVDRPRRWTAEVNATMEETRYYVRLPG